MLASQLAEIIRCAPLRTLDDVSRDIWRAIEAGLLTDDEAQALAEAVHARRQAARCQETAERPRPPVSPPGRAWSYFPPKRPQRSLDRAKAWKRRRTLAAASPMPPVLAARFTTGEQAALAIVAAEVREKGTCARTVAEIAARAGISATTVRNAIRAAARIGLLTVEERRQHCAPNLANVVRIVSREWMAWIGKRSSWGERMQKNKAHGHQGFKGYREVRRNGSEHPYAEKAHSIPFCSEASDQQARRASQGGR